MQKENTDNEPISVILHNSPSITERSQSSGPEHHPTQDELPAVNDRETEG